MLRRIGLMQPYLFPYLGYFQLISAVDVFVLYDDVQFIQRGWINRNKILINGDEGLITLSLKKAPRSSKINERIFSDNFSYETEKLLRTLYFSYSKAPRFPQVFPLLESIIRFPERNIASYIENSIRKLCSYLELPNEILLSSDLSIGTELTGQDRIIEIVKTLGGWMYINPVGGAQLYDHDEFLENGIVLQFMRTSNSPYPQFGNNFVPSLSIIDVLMFNELWKIQERLSSYSLEDKPSVAKRAASFLGT